MIQVFFGAMAFSLCLMAFCAGTWLTVWSLSNNQYTNSNAAKLSGYFITVLAIVSLVFTSYYFARSLFMPSYSHPMMMSSVKPGMMKNHPGMNSHIKPSNTTTKTTTPKGQ